MQLGPAGITWSNGDEISWACDSTSTEPFSGLISGFSESSSLGTSSGVGLALQVNPTCVVSGGEVGLYPAE